MPIKKQLLAGVLLGVAGFAGNWFRYPLFLNIDFLFGSFFVMSALLRYGIGAGVVASLLASSCTWLMWKHPYAIIIFTLETVIVGILNSKRKKADILFNDIVYWFCFGAPLVWLCYHNLLHDNHASTILIICKQAMNGIFNALLASIFFLILLSREKAAANLPSFRQLLCTIMISLVLFPAFIHIFYNLRTTSGISSKLLARQTTNAASSVGAIAGFWLSDHQSGVAGGLQTEALLRQIKAIVGAQEMHITILNQVGRVVVSTRNDLGSGMPFQGQVNGSKRPITSEVDHLIPAPEKGRNLMQRWAKSWYVAEIEVSPESRWQVVVENAYAPLLNDLRDNATTALAGLVFLSLLIVPLSNLLSYRLTRSLEKLRNTTRSLPEDIRNNMPESLPLSSIREVAELVENFHVTRGVLQEQHDELQQYNETLEEKNAVLVANDAAMKLLLQRFSQAQKAADAGLWDWDMQTDKLTWSPELFMLFGLDAERDEASFEQWQRVMHPDDWLGAELRVKSAVENRERLYNEYRIMRGSEIRWISSIGDTTYDEPGAPVRMSGICLDITKRKQAEERLHLLADTAGMLLMSDSPQDVVDTLCKRALPILGCDAFFNYLVDQGSGRLRLNACTGIPQEDREKILWLDFRVAVCGCVARDGCRIVTEDILSTPDDNTDLIKSFGINAYACHPLMLGEEVLGTLSFGSCSKDRFSEDDLAVMKAVADLVAIALERKRSEVIIQQAKREWELTFDSVPDLIAILDEQHRIIRVNRSLAKHLGLGPAECIGRYCYDVVHGLVHAPDFCPHAHTLCDNKTHAVEVYEESLHGDFLVSTTPLHQDDGKLIGTVHIARDISDRKKAENKLQQTLDQLEEKVRERTAQLEDTITVLQEEVNERQKAQESLRVEMLERVRIMESLRDQEKLMILQSRQAAMGEMIGNIAHQWRQPLNILGLLLQQMELFFETGKFDANYLGQSVGKGMGIIQHMSRTIDDFRNFFRPDKEQKRFSISETINNTIALISDSFVSHMISIEVNNTCELEVDGYPNEFAQALLNILLNAKDVLLERKIAGPRISIAVSKAAGKGMIVIKDNAGGIAEEIIDKIFDPYFTTKGPQQGTGLGLYMAKMIIEKSMGGDLRARNGEEGAEFFIEVGNVTT
ncbi:blue-light-activated protein [Geobacter sp. OR-1]|uniref:GAF domain-containing sensor histidine kinase n=1 Tax=Geobacter sp. OR-1 TaxID=1266765 RepID=UPI000542D0CA|nr:PAS domain S-box protein [Geobacter sp. OR-1]GAM09358.1 blue-light-activated protein [Geobacter sp. OR-1]